MKKSKLKRAVNKAMGRYYESGLTNTADSVRKLLFKEIDRLYTPKTNKR